MAIILTSKYLSELRKNANIPNVIIEVALDSGSRKFGYHTGRISPSKIVLYLADGLWVADGRIPASGSSDYSTTFAAILPVLKAVSSLQNKIDTKKGYSTRGQLTVVINGKDNFKGLLKDEYLKNRRINRKDGFVSREFAYSDYAETFTGKVLDWTRRGDELTLILGDDMRVDAEKKIPVEDAKKTQNIDYRNTNPVDIVTDILSNRLGIGASYVDTAQFNNERDTWLNGWRFDRVLTEPKRANEYLNELQIETNSFIIHDGEQISFKIFAPPLPGQNVEEWGEGTRILKDTFTQKSGYTDNFFNRVVVHYDYDESGGDKPENFETWYIATDSASQGASEWDETKTKVIKSKWIRTRTYTQPSNITGVTIYHCSRANGAGSGTLTYDNAANTLEWTAPGGTAGDTVTLDNDGKYQLFDGNKTKWVRVVVDTSSLPGTSQTDTVTISALSGDTYAATLANKILSRYRDPVSTVSFQVDINNVAYNSTFRKPTDIFDLTTDEACDKGKNTWTKERMMITSLRPDFSASKVQLEAVQTKMYRTYGFIAPAGYPDYPGATDAQKEYAFIRDTSPQYHIW